MLQSNYSFGHLLDELNFKSHESKRNIVRLLCVIGILSKDRNIHIEALKMQDSDIDNILHCTAPFKIVYISTALEYTSIKIEPELKIIDDTVVSIPQFTNFMSTLLWLNSDAQDIRGIRVRQTKQERTDMQKISDLEDKKGIIIELFRNLGFIDDIMPIHNENIYSVSIFGASASSALKRVRYLRDIIDKGLLPNVSKIYILSGKRGLWFDNALERIYIIKIAKQKSYQDKDDNIINLEQHVINVIHKADDLIKTIGSVDRIDKINICKILLAESIGLYQKENIIDTLKTERLLGVPMKDIIKKNYSDILEEIDKEYLWPDEIDLLEYIVEEEGLSKKQGIDVICIKCYKLCDSGIGRADTKGTLEHLFEVYGDEIKSLNGNMLFVSSQPSVFYQEYVAKKQILLSAPDLVSCASGAGIDHLDTINILALFEGLISFIYSFKEYTLEQNKLKTQCTDECSKLADDSLDFMLRAPDTNKFITISNAYCSK